MPIATREGLKESQTVKQGISEGKYGDLAAMARLAFSSGTRSDVLKDLAESEDTSIREMVAGNQKTPVETLRRLLWDCSLDVEGAAIRNLLRRGIMPKEGRDEMWIF